MALTKTTFAAMDNEVQPYFIYNTSDTTTVRARKSQSSGPSGYFMFWQNDNAWKQWWVRITLTTDGGGVRSLKFSLPSMTNNTGTWYYRLSTSSSYVCYETNRNSWSPLSVQGNQARTIDLGTVNMHPNTTYYLWLYAPYGASYTGNMGFTATGTYGEPGNITANNANFDSPVTMSFGSTTSGGTYTVYVNVNGLGNETLQNNGTATSLTWTPALSSYASRITNASSVTAVITVYTYFGGQLSGSRTKNITLSFTAAQVGPSLATGAFSIAPYNTGVIAGLTGYIQNYSKIRATRDNSLVTYQYGASFASWRVKFGTATEVTGLTGTTQDSAVQGGTGSVTVTCTVVDTRGFTASLTFTATMTPYQMPTMQATMERTDSTGTPAADGAYVTVNAAALYASVDNQNTISIKLFVKLASATDFPAQGLNVDDGSTPATSGTNKTFSPIQIFSGFSDVVYNLKLVATDSLGNSYELYETIASDKWFLNAFTDGDGAAFGKAAEYQDVLDIGDWDLYLRDGNGNIVSLKTALGIT